MSLLFGNVFFEHKKDDLLQSSLPDFYFIFIGAFQPHRQHYMSTVSRSIPTTTV